MRVLILGASGIVGQFMRLSCPDHVRAIYHRRVADTLHVGADLLDAEQAMALLEATEPDVIVNLAGESRPDVVERDPMAYEEINVTTPFNLAQYCELTGARLVQVSSQAVFSGQEPPYSPSSPTAPINAYGDQKMRAEKLALSLGHNIVVRATFVLGVRPLPHVGRANPVEQILAGGQTKQAVDRWFSPLFARDAAKALWSIVVFGSEPIVHLGNPITVSRCKVATSLGADVEPVPHSSFPGIAPRPVNTTYDAAGTGWFTEFSDGIAQLKRDWYGRMNLDIPERAREIALFLGIREDEALAKLSRGFGALHAEVNADFRRANPGDDEARLLEWYRTTESYIYELSAYHADAGFNYSGMCEGIAERLKQAGARRVLCLGDGIGDLTLELHNAGFEAVYHDLEGSRTAEFARFRFQRLTGEEMRTDPTINWAPLILPHWHDAVVSLDFLEHVPNVAEWTAAIKDALVPGGLLIAQNAFACGSGPNGSIPMHLACNDRYEVDWDPELAALGFTQLGSNWYRRAA